MARASKGDLDVGVLDRTGIVVLRQKTPSDFIWIVAALAVAAAGAVLFHWSEVISERFKDVIPYPAAALFFMGVAPAVVRAGDVVNFVAGRRPALRIDRTGFSFFEYGERKSFRWDEVGRFSVVHSTRYHSQLVAFKVLSSRQKDDRGDAEDPSPMLPILADLDAEQLCQLINEHRTAAINPTDHG